MAQPQVSGADGIRSLTDEDAVFGAFDSYPWLKDKTFMVRRPQIRHCLINVLTYLS